MAPIDYLLCLPIRYDRKCVNKLSSTVPKATFYAFDLLSKIEKMLIFNTSDIIPVYSKPPSSLDTSIARSLLNQPIFMNHLFVSTDNKRLRSSVLCEHFFIVADIWSFEHNNLNFSAITRAKANVDFQGYPLSPDELALFPVSPFELQKVWLKILTPTLINFLRWAKPSRDSTCGDNCGTTLMLKLASFDNPSTSPPFKVDCVYTFSVKSKITVAMLTKHFTAIHCTEKMSSAINFPGIKKWILNHNCLGNHGWTDTFKYWLINQSPLMLGTRL